MNVHLMAQRLPVHERARRDLIRRHVEKDLVCPACGKRNRLGARAIDLDDMDTAWCPCGYSWSVSIQYDG